MSAAAWAARARSRVLDVLNEHLAVVHAELEARISEPLTPSGNIDPHHVTTALRDLSKQGHVEFHAAASRGGRVITTITAADMGRRKTAIQRVEARKRLLYSRYAGWSQGTIRDPHGLIGPAGERAVRSAILDAQTVIPSVKGAGEVRTLLGHRLTGPLDSAGLMVPLDHGIPGEPVTLMVEVKNLRSWIYPSSAELYQLLAKAVDLQQARPKSPIVPILVCRRNHPTTFWMAKQLGFVVVEMQMQFAGKIDQKSLDEVRNELFLHDLRTGEGPSLRVRDRFRDTLPTICSHVADLWQATALDDHLAEAIREVRSARSSVSRLRRVDDLKSLAKGKGHRGW